MRFLRFLERFSIVSLIGAHPIAASATMLLTGVGSLVAAALLNPSTITRFTTTYFRLSALMGCLCARDSRAGCRSRGPEAMRSLRRT